MMFLVVAFASCFFTVSALDEADSLSRMMTVSDDELPANSLVKVQRMIARLKSKVNNETKLNTKMHKEYQGWCSESMATTNNEIDYHTELADKYYAVCEQTSAAVKLAQEAIDKLFTELTVTQTQLKRATEARDRENADYEANKADLEESLKAISHAIKILSAELAKNPAALAQVNTHTIQALLQTFGTAMDAVSLPSNDKQRLMALIQSQREQADEDSDANISMVQPAYKSKSGDIVDLLEDMQEKAKKQLSEMEDDEIKAKGTYDILKVTLEAQIKQEQLALDKQKEGKGGALKDHADAEKDYNTAKADMDHNKKTLKDLEKDCKDQCADYHKFLKEQQNELDTLDKALEAIGEAMGSLGGPQDMTSAGDMSLISAIQPSSQLTSLLQVDSAEQVNAAHFNRVATQIVGIVKNVGKKHHDMALTQLASRMKSLLRYTSGTGDIFVKVKGLIKDMIAKLEDELGDQVKEQGFCDKEMQLTKKKLEDLGIDIDKLDRLHDLSYMKEVDLTAWLKSISKAIAKDAAESKRRTEIFNEQSRNYYNTMADLKDAQKAVQKAIAVLTEYYGQPVEKEGVSTTESMTEEQEVQHEHTMHAMDPSLLQTNSAQKSASKKQEMQGHGIIEVLAIIESDIAESIRLEDEMFGKLKVDYKDVLDEYVASRALNEKDKANGEKDYTSIHRETGEIWSDETSELNEKEQLSLYYFKLRDRCITRAERFDDRKKARDEEIAALKEVLQILHTETQWIQEDSTRSFRGSQRLRQFPIHS